MSATETDVRARAPDQTGFATAADGLRLYWELHGGGSTTIVLLPANPISHSRLWKGQVHYLARHHRVVVYAGPGSGAPPPPRGRLRRSGQLPLRSAGRVRALARGVAG